MPGGRRTRCDACRSVKPDCLWTERVSSRQRYVVCKSCREYWRTCGHELSNVDPDYPVAEDAVVLVKKGE